MGCGACASKKSTAVVLPSVRPAINWVAPSLTADLKSQWSNSEYQKLTSEWEKVRSRSGGLAALAKEKVEELKERAGKGLTVEVRWGVWKALLGIDNSTSDDYPTYLSQLLPSSVQHDIKKDLDRTFPEFDYFHSSGQQALSNVLHALAIADPEVAYCQGLNCVVAMLLLVSNGDEAGSFAVYREASQRFRWRGFYLQEFPKMWEMTYQWQALFKARDPTMYRFLKSIGVQEALWLTKGLLTVFSALLPMSLAIRVWDELLVSGPDVLFQTALTVMFSLRTEVQGQDLAAVATLLRELPKRPFPANQFVAALRKEAVSPELLEKGAAKYRKKQQQLTNIVS